MVNREIVNGVGDGLRVQATPAPSAAAATVVARNGAARLQSGVGDRRVTPAAVSTIAG